jgi:hypothetical protein
MRTVSGLFMTYLGARSAIHALNDAGIKSADISLIANSPDDLTPEASAVRKDTAAGAEVGALLGGAGGLLAGLGILAIPGLGPIIGGGWLVATLMGAVAGAATGGLIGLLTDAGIPKSDAHVYAEGVRRGGALVTARVTDAQETTAASVLKAAGAQDPVGLRASYESEGWREFDATAPAPADDVSSRDRDRFPIVPPVI